LRPGGGADASNTAERRPPRAVAIGLYVAYTNDVDRCRAAEWRDRTDPSGLSEPMTAESGGDCCHRRGSDQGSGHASSIGLAGRADHARLRSIALTLLVAR